MTLNDIIDGIFIREGDVYRVVDQPTGRGGITLATYQRFCDAMQPGRRVTVLDLQALSHDEARGIIQWVLEQLLEHAKLQTITWEPLRLQMLDFAYNSGAERAIRWLQRVLGCAVTGEMDLQTVQTLAPESARLVNLALVAARCQMLVHSVDSHLIGRNLEHGLLNRAVQFTTLTV